MTKYASLALTTNGEVGVARFDTIDDTEVRVRWNTQQKEYREGPIVMYGLAADANIAYIQFSAMRCLPYIYHGFSDPIIRSITDLANVANIHHVSIAALMEECEKAFNINATYSFINKISPIDGGKEIMTMLMELRKRKI